MLYSYMQQTEFLLSDVKQQITNPLFIKTWVNKARGQLAGEAECIRVSGRLTLTTNVRIFAFSAIGLSGAQGVQGPLNVRMMRYLSGDGALPIYPESYEWFNQFYQSLPVQVPGSPQRWAQYGQGVNGFILVHPIPDTNYTADLDMVCYPSDLNTDTDFEAIPYPWTDAVPFFAAYFAYFSLQRQKEADAMLQQYKNFIDRARGMSTPAVLPHLYSQVSDPTKLNKLGLQPTKGTAG